MVEGSHDVGAELIFKEGFAFELFWSKHLKLGSCVENTPVIFIVAGLPGVLNKDLHINYKLLAHN